MFRRETSSYINNNNLSAIFEEKGNLNEQTDKFLKKLEKTIQKCFRKIRVKNKVDKVKEDLFKKWKHLKSKTDEISKTELKRVEKELADKYAEEYFDKIKKYVGNIDCLDGNLNSGSLWNLKKQLFPQSRDPPTAMLDPRSGQLLTNEEHIQEAALFTYKKRLENKPIRNNLEHIKIAKEKLCEKLLKVARNNKTPEWKMKDLDKVLKQLKHNKSRDPLGYCNELFRPEVAGDDLKLAILKLMNKIKEEQVYPDCMQLCNISSIWKKKNNKNDFESYRGIFRVTIFRTILDKLIYNDEYETLDANLTDCNVGARKHRNIRDNIFVMNAVINSIKKGNEKPADFQVYDVEKCFDSLWLHEVINCLYEAGLCNDKLPLLFLENSIAKVAVKTSGGISNRESIMNIIMQGSVFGSLGCVVLMDKLGQQLYSKPDKLFYYKGVVPTPPLQMVDDILGIQTCSKKSVHLNNTINTFIELEKLNLSDKKCHNVHIGKNEHKCHDLRVHTGKMTNAKQEKYLGDIIHKSGMLRHTVEARVAKGYGAVSTILAIVSEIPLGHWKLQAGLQLRQALLLNGILFNSEAWHAISKAEIEHIEKVDEALLRGLLKAHSKLALEALYLETGSIPIRYIIKNRRLNYLYTVVAKEKEELVNEIYSAQKASPTEGDFCKLVEADKIEINLQIQDEEISQMNETKYKNIIKFKIKEAAFKRLLEIKSNHSKLNNITYNKLEIQSYLQSPLFGSEDVQMLLALRTRTVRGVKSDFRGMFQDAECPLGCGSTDTLENILTCSVLQKNLQSETLANNKITFADIYSSDIRAQKQVTELYTKLMSIRENIMNNSPVQTGPCINLQRPSILSN